MVINFNINWNKKLDTKAFTTIRLYNPKKYVIGKEYQINLKQKKHCNAIIIDIKEFRLSQLGIWVSYIETGHDVKSTIEILKRIYHQQELDTHPLYLILLQRI